MKLIQTPVNKSLNLENFYPQITDYIFKDDVINYYNLYTADRLQIIYADLFDTIRVVLIDGRKKIKKEEVDFVLHRLLHVEREDVTMQVNIKSEMEAAGIQFLKPRKDIIVIELPNK
ncbi:MAG: DUF1827 family protein [Enterococcus sp.]